MLWPDRIGSAYALRVQLEWLRTLVAVVETGSFTKGADRAAVTQSTISISIAKLEAEFGVQLLERRSPVVPTGAGERLVEVGKTILQLYSVVKGELETSPNRSFCGLEYCNPSPVATFPDC